MRGLEGTLAPENSTSGFVWVKKSQVNADKILSYRQLHDQLTDPKRHHRRIQSSFTQNSQKLETNQIYIKSTMGKFTIVDSYTGIPHSNLTD